MVPDHDAMSEPCILAASSIIKPPAPYFSREDHHDHPNQIVVWGALVV